jgi:beta-lactamase regulating signal transducer with metallopeptidase domain
MVALTFSQFADVAYPLAWQVTLTLMHVLWIGVAIAALAGFVDRVLAKGTGDAASPDFGSANTRVRCWLNMTALVALAAALPITFLVVKGSAAEFGTSASRRMVESDESGGSNQNAAGRHNNPASAVARSAINELPAGQLARTSQAAQVQHGEVAVPLQESLLNQLRSVAPAIAIVYLVGVLMMLVRLAAALCGGQRLTSFGHPVTEHLVLNVLTTEAERLALKAVPMVAYCERVAVPVVVGVLKPVILLPAAMMSVLSSQELAAVLAHELAHVKRFDHVLIVVQRFLEAVLFFHPAVWWLGRRIHDLREHACDDLVIQGGTDRMEYARSLLRVAELRVRDDARAGQLAQLALDGGDPSKLRQRIQRIVQSNDEPGVRLNQSRATFSLVASAMAIALSLVPALPGISEEPVDAAAAPVVAAEESSANQASAGEVAEKKRLKVVEKLQQAAELHVEEMPLIAVLDAVEKSSGVSVTVDLRAFAMRGVDPQGAITIDVEDVTVEQLFDRIATQAHLTFEITEKGIVIPASTPALEFRIVADLPDPEAKVRVPAAWGKLHYRDGTIKGVGPVRNDGFVWFPLKPPLQRKKVGGVDVQISDGNESSPVGLLSDSPDHILTTDGSWHVLDVDIRDDGSGGRAIQIKLDEAGGQRMLKLSVGFLGHKMAIVVNGVVILAPRVNWVIEDQMMISGNFSDDELTMIADAIRKAIVPSGKVLTYNCDVTDEKTGEPVAGAKVLWRVQKSPFKKGEEAIFEERFTTDKDGRYTVVLPREAFEQAQLTTEFEVTHADYLPKKRVGTRLTLPNAPKPAWSDLRHLKLFRGVPVSGRFINPDGSPAANLPLVVSRSRDAPGAGFRGDVIGRTDAEGRYRLVTTSSWPKRLHWFPENSISDSVALKKATDNPKPITFGDQGTVRLKNGPRLTGSVVDQNGKGLEGIFVQAFTGTTVPILYAKTNADGKFAFTPSPPAEYRLSTTDGFIDPLTETYRGRTLTRPFQGVTVNLPKSGEAKPTLIRQAQSDALTVIAYQEDGEPALNRQFWTGIEPYRSATSEPVEEEPGKYRLWVRRGTRGQITTNRPHETATVWQRANDSVPAPGAGLALGKVKRNSEVVVRFRQSGTIRVVAKFADQMIRWDVRSVTAKYARSAEFEKLGVYRPGFLITVPQQGPEHVIQRVAPNEDVIIDVGIRGRSRKQQTVRVGAGESITVTIDLASKIVSKLPGDVRLRYAIKSKEVADAEYAMSLAANLKVPGCVPEIELRRLRLASEKAAIEIEMAGPKVDDDVRLRYAMKSKEFADADYAMSLEANQKVPGTVPETELRKLKLASEKAAQNVAELQSKAEAAKPRYAALSVAYQLDGAEKEARIIIQNTGVPNSNIGSMQKGMMRYTPLKVGESSQLNKLVPGVYKVARSREVELIT